MNEGYLGVFLLVASVVALIWLGVAVFRGSTLTARIGSGEGRGRPENALTEGTQAVVSKTLRPAGTIEYDSVPYDAISEGEFIEAGAKVVVIGKSGKSVMVRRVKGQ